ncbi:hypothetical protein [Paenibacillus turpanensis]|uniref:hypothetical protein n=1 Tax=Paenibacillus turpanensis TaxID=2689078 RepID=UPI00140B2000|nr:hypothetical protein [Paenibacillus turpanensis]
MKLKVKLSIFLSVALSLFTFSTVFGAAHTVNKPDKNYEKKQVIQQLTEEEIEKLAMSYGQDPKSIKGAVKIIEFGIPESSEFGEFTTAAAEYYLENITHEEVGGNTFRTDRIAGPNKYSADISNTMSSEISTELSSEAGVDGSKIAAKLGAKWIVGQTFTTKVGPVEVPSGKTYSFYFAPLKDHYEFDLWEDDLIYDDFIGSFWFQEPKGIYHWWQDTTGW